MQSIFQDVRFALRTLRRRPAFTALAVVTLGLGIGATTAIYSVVDTVLLRPLPFRDAGSLVAAFRTYPEWKDDDILRVSWDQIAWSYPNRCDFWMMTSLFMVARSGSAIIFC